MTTATDEGPPSEHEILSRALQELLEEKGVLTAEQVRKRMELSRRSFRSAARASSRTPGRIRRSRSGCSPTARRRAPNGASTSRRTA
jgi:hypothetical protein